MKINAMDLPLRKVLLKKELAEAKIKAIIDSFGKETSLRVKQVNIAHEFAEDTCCNTDFLDVTLVIEL